MVKFKKQSKICHWQLVPEFKISIYYSRVLRLSLLIIIQITIRFYGFRGFMFSICGSSKFE